MLEKKRKRKRDNYEEAEDRPITKKDRGDQKKNYDNEPGQDEWKDYEIDGDYNSVSKGQEYPEVDDSSAIKEHHDESVIIVDEHFVHSFRKAIQKEDCLEAIKNFASVCSIPENQHVVMDYLKAGGGVKELFKIIKGREENKTLVLYVFTALRHVILSIVASAQENHLSSTEEACIEFLNNHISLVNHFLKEKATQTQIEARKLKLKSIVQLLTAMVTVSSKLAVYILNHVQFTTSLLEVLTRHSNPYKKSVRVALIHFIMAFLLCGDVAVIRNLLAIKGLCTCMVPRMMYDSVDNVLLVLSTFRTQIVLDRTINKTLKMHTFSTMVLRNLIDLYSWKGPSLKKATTEDQFLSENQELIRKEEMRSIRSELNRLLEVLCTSYNLGIAFENKFIEGKVEQNKLLDSLVYYINEPWQDDDKAHLVIKIVETCPELLNLVCKKIVPFLEPRMSTSWLQMMKFTRRLLENLDPEKCLKPYLNNILPDDVPNEIRRLTIPDILIKDVLYFEMFQHKDLTIRHEAVSLVLTMLKQFNRFITTVQQSNAISYINLQQLKQTVLEGFLTADNVNSLWDMLLTPEDKNNYGQILTADNSMKPGLSSHLLTLLDFMMIYNETLPHILDALWCRNFLKDVDSILILEEDTEASALVQVKVLQLMMSVDSFASAPDKKMFKEALIRLSKIVDSSSATMSLKARNLLCTYLLNTGLFEQYRSEVLVWLHCLLAVPEEERKSVISLLVKSIVNICQNPVVYMNYISTSAEAAATEGQEQYVESSRLEDIFNDILEATGDEFEEKTIETTATVFLSPLLAGVLEAADAYKDKKGNVENFISYVVIHLLHSQTSPQIIVHLLERWPELLPSSVTAYVNGWLSGDLQPLKQQLGSNNIEKKLSKSLLHSESSSVSHVLGLQYEIKTEDETSSELSETYDIEKLKTKDPLYILLLYKLSVFHLAQLASRGELSTELRDRCKDALLSLLKIISDIDKKEENETCKALSKKLAQIIGEQDLRIHCLKYTLTHPVLFQTFTPICWEENSIEKLMTELILDFVKVYPVSREDTKTLHCFLKPFKEKLIHQIMDKLEKYEKDKTSSLNIEGFISMVELFELDFPNVVKLLDYINEKPNETLKKESDDTVSLSVWCFLLNHLLVRCVAMHRSLKLKTVSSLFNKVSWLEKEKAPDVSQLEDSFFQYLEQFPHNLALPVTEKLFISLLRKEELSISSVKLAVLLLSHKTKLSDVFFVQIRFRQIRQKADLFIPLLSAALKNNAFIDETILIKICADYEAYIQKAVLKPSKSPQWLKENASVLGHLIEKGIGIEFASKLCKEIKSNPIKTKGIQEFYVDLVKSIYLKVARNQDNEEERVNLVLYFIELLIILSNEEIMNEKLVYYLSQQLQDVVTSDKTLNWKPVTASTLWKPFIKICVKFGLQSSKDSEGILLATLSKLCNVIYQSDEENVQICDIFQWTTSHSEFYNVMLGSTQKKYQLVKLLLTLVKKNTSVMSEGHITLFLSSYNASMNEIDQLILQLLQWYEGNGVHLNDCRPYLWGESAVSYYKIKTNVELSLWRQPSSFQLLNSLQMSCVLDTIANFPLNRGLCDSKCEVAPADCTIYDPAFYLPVFSQMLAPEEIVRPMKFSRTGALALTLVALASNSEGIRAAACHVISRLYYHWDLDVRNQRERQLTLQFLDAICYGVAYLKKNTENPKLTAIIATFLARTSLILSDTSNGMYYKLQYFIIARSFLDMKTIPQFFNYFHSSEVSHRKFRVWILRVISDGMKSEVDFHISEKSSVLKLLMGFYSSVLSDDEIKRFILNIIKAAVKIEVPAKMLVTKKGLISWLHEVIQGLQQNDVKLTSLAVDIIFSLWNTLHKQSEKTVQTASKAVSTAEKVYPGVHIPQQLLLLSLKALQKFDSKLTLTDLSRFFQTINGILTFSSDKTLCLQISTQDLEKILGVAKEVLGSVSDCEDLLQYGCRFASKCQKCDSKIESEETLYHLRSLIITWSQIMYKGLPPS